MNQFIYPLKIYIEDTDYGGVVYHANYLKFFERARTEWAYALGLGFEWQKAQKIFFAIRAVTIDFLKPALLGDELESVSRVAGMRSSSICFQQHLRYSHATDTILCKAEIKIVCVNEKFRPQAVPPCRFHELAAGE